MKLKHLYILSIIFLGFLSTQKLQGQETEKINWLTFGQLNDSLAKNPKKVFINFYADWCTPCHKMDKKTYTDPRIIEKINKEYYAVKMNVESNDTIAFGGQIYTNQKINRPNPIHQIPLLMASRKDKPFSLPAIVLTNDKFVATDRYFQYLDAEQLLSIL